MRWLPLFLILPCLVVGKSGAAERWEGSDDFSSSASSNAKWRKISRGAKGEASWFEGKVVYSSSAPDSDNSAAWGWGWGKGFTIKPNAIPTHRSWEISCEVYYPASAPNANLSQVVAGLVVGWFPHQKAYRAVYGRVHVAYDASGNIANATRCESDFNFELRANSMGGGPAEAEGSFSTGAGRFGLKFRHNSLTQTDRFEVRNLDSDEVVYSRTDTSTLSLTPLCGVGFYMELDDNRTWPGLSNNMAVDNWKVEAFNPDPVNLVVKNGVAKGVAYSLAVNGLGMTGARLSGSATVTVGAATATIPVTGSIDKNGYLDLTGRGTGSAKGFGCRLLYDPSAGTYRPNKNSVTAPKQKAIRF